MHIVCGEAGPVGFYDEAANLAFVLVALGPDDRYVCNGSRRDPHLLTVEDVFVALPHSPGFHAARIRSESRFRETEAADLLSLGKQRKPLILLIVTAKGIDGIHDQR